MKKWSFFHFILIQRNIFLIQIFWNIEKIDFKLLAAKLSAAKLSCGETVCGETVWGESGSRWKCLRWNCSQRNRLRRNFLEPASKYGDEAHAHVQNQWRSFYYFVPKENKLYTFCSKSSETSKKLILLRGSKLEEERGKVKIAYIFLSYGLNSITSFLTEKNSTHYSTKT